MWRWGAGGAGGSSKANQMSVLGLSQHGGRTGHGPLDHRDPDRPLILLWKVSVQDCFGGKFQLVLKAPHLRVVLAWQLLQLAVLATLHSSMLDALLSPPRQAAILTPDEPLQVVAHSPNHKGHRKGDVGGIGPYHGLKTSAARAQPRTRNPRTAQLRVALRWLPQDPAHWP